MGENRRNSSSGIIILFFLFFFFSFFHDEKERQITRTTTQTSDISNANSLSLAVICPIVSTPGINLHWTSTLNIRFSGLVCASCREFIFNNFLSSSFSSCQRKFHFRNPVISLFFLQKVPEQGKEDDAPSIT